MHQEHVVSRQLPDEVVGNEAPDVAQQVDVLDRILGLELRRKSGFQGSQRGHYQGCQEGAVRPFLQYHEP